MYYGTIQRLEGDTKTEEVVLGGLDAMKGDPGYAQTARFVAEAGVNCISYTHI